jgi:hypothetical protein
MGLALSALFAGLGATFLLTGGGIIWATRGTKEEIDMDDMVVRDFTPQDIVGAPEVTKTN